MSAQMMIGSFLTRSIKTPAKSPKSGNVSEPHSFTKTRLRHRPSSQRAGVKNEFMNSHGTCSMRQIWTRDRGVQASFAHLSRRRQLVSGVSWPGKLEQTALLHFRVFDVTGGEIGVAQGFVHFDKTGAQRG